MNKIWAEQIAHRLILERLEEKQLSGAGPSISCAGNEAAPSFTEKFEFPVDSIDVLTDLDKELIKNLNYRTQFVSLK